MLQVKGKGIGKGVAIGRILFYDKGEQTVRRVSVEDTSAELARFEDAKTKAQDQLQLLYEKALKEVGEENAAIFEVHQMMLDDEDYLDSITNIINTEKVCAEYAVATTGDNFAEMFANMDDDYFKARSADVKDISERVVRVLSGAAEMSELTEPVIMVAEDLAPSETVQFDKSKLLAFVTHLGSANSHTAILARMMNLPAIIGISIDPAWNGKQAIVDGYTGTVTIDPDDELMKEMLLVRHRDEERRELLQQLKGKPTVSKSGKKIRLFANIGGVKDTGAALENDAEGVGLFRSEFLYLESSDLPSEETQFAAYKTVAQNMAGK